VATLWRVGRLYRFAMLTFPPADGYPRYQSLAISPLISAWMKF
jgi:hypothetical protein